MKFNLKNISLKIKNKNWDVIRKLFPRAAIRFHNKTL